MKFFNIIKIFFILIVMVANLNAFLFFDDNSDNDGSSATSPKNIVIDGEKINDDSPTKYYSFYSSIKQNITVNITDHDETSSYCSSDSCNKNLTLTLYNLNDDGSCNTSTSIGSYTQDGEFNWNFSTNAVTNYCLEVKGNSSSMTFNNDYDINLTSDAQLEVGIADSSKKEDDSPMTFIIALTKASSNDVVINYTFEDNSAINGTNYKGTDGSITIPAGSLSKSIDVTLYDKDITTNKTFTINISSDDVTVNSNNSYATGTILPSSTVSGETNSDYEGPDICYDSRETNGFCMFGSCIFYKEETNVRSMVDGLSNIDIKKALTRGMAFLDFASEIGINEEEKTLEVDDDEAEKKTFASGDFYGYFDVGMFPKGIEYRVGNGANNTQGGSLNKNETTSYYDKSLFKFGLFTQYTSLVTYTKNGETYQEVLQACNPDTYGALDSKPLPNDCGVFLGALNSATKINFNSSSWQTINYQTELNTPAINGSTGLCNNSTCKADGIGSTKLSLPTFISSKQNDIVNIPYSLVVADQHVGNLVVTTTSDTDENEDERVIVFEAPYSSSYNGRVMFIKSIIDKDNHADNYRYVFKDGDYWIGEWILDKSKTITIETTKNVRFFINSNFNIKTTTTGEIRIGYNPDVDSTSACNDPHFYMFLYNDFSIDAAGSTHIKNGYIYSKGNVTIAGNGAFAAYYSPITADGEININTVGSGAYTAYLSSDDGVCKDSSNTNSNFFNECSSAGGGITFNAEYGIFNIIENTTTIGSTDPLDSSNHINDIYTKIIKESFDAKLVALKSDKETLKDYIEAYISVDVAHINDDNTYTLIKEYIYEGGFNYDTLLNSDKTYTLQNLNIDLIDKRATFIINYIDWSGIFLQKSCENKKLATYSDSNTGEMAGIPKCYKENELKEIFGASHRCFDDSITGNPCGNHGDNQGNGEETYRNRYHHQYGCARCLADENKVAARDDFAIRPYGFMVFGKNQYKRAGEDFNLIIKAVDKENFEKISGDSSSVDTIKGYNENIGDLNISALSYTPSDDDISQMIEDVNASVKEDVITCPRPSSFSINSNKFTDGEVNATLEYPETGITEIEVKETNGNEYAVVDADDNIDDSIRFIKKGEKLYDKNDISKTNILLFIPYKFDTSVTYNTTTAQDWLYTSNEVSNSSSILKTPKMAAYIEYTIKAKNKNGDVLKNYTKTCFPDVDETKAPRVNGLKLNSTFDLFLDIKLSIDTEKTINVYTEDTNSSAIWTPNKTINLLSGTNNIQEWIGPKHFTNGVGKARVYFNIKRKVNQAHNPIKIKLIEANTSTSWMTNEGATNVFNGDIKNEEKTFLYAKAHIPDTTITGKEGNVSIYYEVYCYDSCDKSLLPNSDDLKNSDDPRWWINKSHTSNEGNVTSISQKRTDSHVISKDIELNKATLEYDENRGYPYRTIMNFIPNEWLIYNKYNSTADHNEFNIQFNDDTSEWIGSGESNNSTNTKRGSKDRKLTW